MNPFSSDVGRKESLSAVTVHCADTVGRIHKRKGSGAVAVAGPSGIGKTTVSRCIQRHLGEHRPAVEAVHLSLDSFLRPELRGDNCYRTDLESPLTPEHYDFHELRRTVSSLQHGETVEVDQYDHGCGWALGKSIVSGRLVLFDGLFLWPPAVPEDAMDIWDLRVYLDAPEEFVRLWRRQRDVGRRTERESDEEWSRVNASWKDHVALASSTADIWATFVDIGHRRLAVRTNRR